MKILESRLDKMVEVTLTDDSELTGRIGQTAVTPSSTAFELQVTEEYDDGTSENDTYIINWTDVRYLRDVRN